MEEAPLELGDKAFIESLLGIQDMYFQGIVKHGSIVRSGNGQKEQSRLIVVSNFRILAIKKNKMGGKRIKLSIPLLRLQSVQVVYEEIILGFTTEPQYLYVTFSEKSGSKQCYSLVRALLFAYEAIAYGRPNKVWVSVPQNFLSGFLSADANDQNGLLASYLAECDLQEVPPSNKVLDYLMSSFRSKQQYFEVRACLSENPGQTAAIFGAMRHSQWFTEVSCDNFKLGNKGLAALATIFSNGQSKVSSLVLDTIKANKAFNALAEHLALGQHRLNKLTIVNNNLGDLVISVLMDALASGGKISEHQQRVQAQERLAILDKQIKNHKGNEHELSDLQRRLQSAGEITGLEILCLRKCNFGEKGFQSISLAAKQMDYLRVLDLSDNKATAKAGAALGDFLLSTRTLAELHITRCDLEVEPVLGALVRNTKLCTNTLEVLNLSGNKFSKVACVYLCTVLNVTASLQHLALQFVLGTAPTITPQSICAQVLDATIDSKKINKMVLDFSENDLGDHILDLNAVMMKYRKQSYGFLIDDKLMNSFPISGLILNNNNFGRKGLGELAVMLKGTALRVLAMDCIIKPGTRLTKGRMAGGVDAGQYLADLCNMKALRELSLVGSETHALRDALHPLLALLPRCSLVHLNVSYNKLGDKGIKLISEALKVNRTLTYLNCDRNRISLEGLQQLCDGIIGIGSTGFGPTSKKEKEAEMIKMIEAQRKLMEKGGLGGSTVLQSEPNDCILDFALIPFTDVGVILGNLKDGEKRSAADIQREREVEICLEKMKSRLALNNKMKLIKEQPTEPKIRDQRFVNRFGAFFDNFMSGRPPPSGVFTSPPGFDGTPSTPSTPSNAPSTPTMANITIAPPPPTPSLSNNSPASAAVAVAPLSTPIAGPRAPPRTSSAEAPLPPLLLPGAANSSLDPIHRVSIAPAFGSSAPLPPTKPVLPPIPTPPSLPTTAPPPLLPRAAPLEEGKIPLSPRQKSVFVAKSVPPPGPPPGWTGRPSSFHPPPPRQSHSQIDSDAPPLFQSTSGIEQLIQPRHRTASTQRRQANTASLATTTLMRDARRMAWAAGAYSESISQIVQPEEDDETI